ncbi:cytochrome P450 [Artomyces pyxidatus]|uniref:Cytochrome P450 n=1 Tax=Artomyces pyxidatus TaxID=48021 RepID=A0ACB8SNB8_9AGAM|nr:cytochrome P450 [Artomyces pyxidatus]
MQVNFNCDSPPSPSLHRTRPRPSATMAISAQTAIDAVLFVVAAFLAWKLWNRPGMSLPPGPKGYPLIGNLLEFPTESPWLRFAEWGKQWGGIMSVTVLGQKFVILNDPQIAIDLLEKRGLTYADRPELPMATLCGWDRAMSSARFGPRIREYRKLIGRVIGTKGAMVKFYPAEDFQATMFLKRVLDHPDMLDAATRKTAGAMILDITYGYKIVEEGSDPLVDLADTALAQFSIATTTGAFLVDLLPWLKYVPSWMPGANFKRIAAKYKKTCDEIGEIPLAWVKEQMANGAARPSYASDLLKDKDISDERMYNIKWSAMSFYGAGADTTVSVVYAYFLAATLYPEVQAKAHAEIDRVVGKDRFPTFEDRDKLPYVEAVCKELLRWLPIVPLAVPHRSLRHDVYEGYAIPEGTLVIANVWKFLHDPDEYINPSEFNPDRFMGPNPAQDPKTYCFGFGRRVCPGTHLADVSVWINVAKAIAAFQVSPSIGPDGKPILPTPEIAGGVICRPKPFKCDVVPRTPQIPKMVADYLAVVDAN